MIGHAVSNCMPVIAANRIGDEDGQLFYGHSFITDQWGDFVAEADAKDHGALVATLDLAQALAMDLGCAWAGGSSEQAPMALDAAIIFAPAGELVPLALAAVRKGGAVVCGGIHMSDIPSFGYELLWGERRLVSVANLTRQDAKDYLPWAAAAGVRPHAISYPLAEANQALDDLRSGAFAGAAVLRP